MSRRSRLNKPPPVPQYIPQLGIEMNVSLSFSHSEWQAPLSAHHPFVNQIREAVSKYRLESAAHFSTSIEVCQAIHSDNPDRFVEVSPNFVICVGFYNFGVSPVITACRPKIHKRERKMAKVHGEEVEVYIRDRFVSLRRFLSIEFPTWEVTVGDEVMFRWWSANGQTFNWKGLPTELKERIVQFCIHRSPPPIFLNKRKSTERRKVADAPEVTDQFGKWISLLSVSHQVRAVSLRLCFAGSSDSKFNNGLCIVAKDFHNFDSCIRRLGRHRQMSEPNGVPTDDTTRKLAKTYKSFPKIYPRLDQYATFRHGIRKVHVQFAFMDSLHFFKVTTGSFSQHWKSYHLDYEVFERLPYLNELIIKLPDAKGSLEDSSEQPVRLFYGEPYSCPRILHRIIYERAAELLAHYKSVSMYGFIDEQEEFRFLGLREDAIKGLKMTTEELGELYMEDAGGVELEKSVDPLVEKEDMGIEEREIVIDDFWPPKCRCEVLCRRTVHPDSI
ncbi:hypothetical protein G6011_06458 [Alternaria panax]|uniref:Uncharacterized protein n=1 Tax=Alternaria panax TaxID=48097 RepID=A0AAD4FHQ6_9PLEO|nr:hypothetical protein G6011_06458 [Alternaria panax]